jgi:hypothetical protein
MSHSCYGTDMKTSHMVRTIVQRSQRQFHAVDVENLLGSPRFDLLDITALKTRYCAIAAVDPCAHITLAASHPAGLLTAGLAWATARRVWYFGRDGADRALTEVLEEEAIAERFEQVFIGSGDGIFAATAARLAAQGSRVIVIARRGHLSRVLRLAAHEVRYLDSFAGSAAVASGRAA